MKINYTGDIGGPVELDVPNAIVKEFLEKAVNTSQWIHMPDMAYERLRYLRRDILEKSKKIVVVVEKKEAE